MGNVVQVGKFIPCNICRKRQAIVLCDMPVGTAKTLHVRMKNGMTDYEDSFKKYTITCDRQVCEKCAVVVDSNFHFCKRCYLKLK